MEAGNKRQREGGVKSRVLIEGLRQKKAPEDIIFPDSAEATVTRKSLYNYLVKDCELKWDYQKFCEDLKVIVDEMKNANLMEHISLIPANICIGCSDMSPFLLFNIYRVTIIEE